MRKQKTSKVSIDQIEQLLAYKNLDNSYKLFWIKGLIAEVEKNNKKIYFNELAKYMIADAWHLVFEKNITLGRLDRVHHIAEEIQEKWNVAEHCSKEEVLKYLDEFDQVELAELLMDLYEETPYTFLEPLYEDKIKKRSINKRIPIVEELSQTDKDSIYAIYGDEKYLVMNSEWIHLLKKDKKKIEALLGDIMAYYLDRSASKRIK